ncbi:hypothetical protein [Deinococcus sp. QL22]|uniref:hypothetical protein n=1 Tax=Deinococcus sp. QL22 TaxID=2939437 RepID=UPI00201834AC|nr:hypothetical protein [Deinococcus sp. QL22]UQN09217.1 hypothetical protein M1R55_24620 [Deinococcus sp. QL22]
MLPDAPTNALQTAFPAKLIQSQLEAVLTAPPTGVDVNVARYSLPGGGVLTRAALLQRASGSSAPTRVTVMVPHDPDQNDAALEVMGGMLQSMALILVDPVPAQLWAERLKVAQRTAFESIRRVSSSPTMFMSLCEGGGTVSGQSQTVSLFHLG